jgi:hypothetical protein
MLLVFKKLNFATENTALFSRKDTEAQSFSFFSDSGDTLYASGYMLLVFKKLNISTEYTALFSRKDAGF